MVLQRTMHSLLPEPFSRHIASRRQEIEALRRYPPEQLAGIIEEVGFSCDLCGRCCTRAFNGHILLLEADAERVRSIDPESLEPPPLYDFCDQHGVFYVSGYTIRAQPGSTGLCHFLENGRCRIYPARPWVCRLYPYMLHREPDEGGVVDWRQISGLDQHGAYHSPLLEGMAEKIARDVMAFECAVLDHEIAFLAYTGRYFMEHGLRHVRKRFDDGMRTVRSGATATVKVYCHGRFESWSVQDVHCTRAEKKGGEA